MKKLLFLASITLFSISTFAQGVEIVPFGGYQFGGSIKFAQGKMNIDNGANYGASIWVPVAPDMEIELNYTTMESNAAFTPYAAYPGLDYQRSNLRTHYMHVGGLRTVSTGGKASPFGSFTLGATYFDSDDFGDVWSFSIAHVWPFLECTIIRSIKVIRKNQHS